MLKVVGGLSKFEPQLYFYNSRKLFLAEPDLQSLDQCQCLRTVVVDILLMTQSFVHFSLLNNLIL